LDEWPFDMEPFDMEPFDMEPFDMEPFDMEPLDIEWVDDILSWSLCAFAPEVIDPFAFDPLDMASVLCPLDIELELEDCASAKLDIPAPTIKAQTIVLA
jgi:hypothetical protein